jgi:hypothetical protein
MRRVAWWAQLKKNFLIGRVTRFSMLHRGFLHFNTEFRFYNKINMPRNIRNAHIPYAVQKQRKQKEAFLKSVPPLNTLTLRMLDPKFTTQDHVF